MRLIEPREHKDFVAAVRHKGMTARDFDFRETDTTDPKSDENCGLQGYVSITRRSTKVMKEYPICDERDWLQHFRKDLDEGVFG